MVATEQCLWLVIGPSILASALKRCTLESAYFVTALVWPISVHSWSISCVLGFCVKCAWGWNEGGGRGDDDGGIILAHG